METEYALLPIAGDPVDPVATDLPQHVHGDDPFADIRSRNHCFSEGEALDYTYETVDTLTIWMGERNSPSYYQGTFSQDGNSITGAWHDPGGGLVHHHDQNSDGIAAWG